MIVLGQNNDTERDNNAKTDQPDHRRIIVITPLSLLHSRRCTGRQHPVSAAIAGSGPITIAALTSNEISAFFTLNSPFWVLLLLLFTIAKIDGQMEPTPQ